MVIKERHVKKFWKVLLAAGGSLDRRSFAKRVFGYNYAAAEMDTLLAVPLLAGLIAVTQERAVYRRGRAPIRYVLTEAGWSLARLWQLPMPSTDLPLEELRGQFDRLVSAGCPWAAELERYAAIGRAWEEQERQRKEARRLKDEERRRRQAEADPPVKNPSKGRHRSAKEKADRAAWRAAHFRKPARPEGAWQPAPQHEARRMAQEAPVSEWSPSTLLPAWYRDLHAPAIADRKTDLIAKIKAAGYQTNSNGQVLYGGVWIQPEEWLKKMPGVLN